MFGRATIRLGIGPHSSLIYFFIFRHCNGWQLRLVVSLHGIALPYLGPFVRVADIYTVSQHQSYGGPDLQAFHSRLPDLSSFWIADMERVVRSRENVET